MKPTHHAVLPSALVAIALAGAAQAQEPETYRLHATLRWADRGLDGGEVMVSWLADGRLLYQTGVRLVGSPSPSFDVPPGVYDVRVEGEHVMTEVKRGMNIIGRDAGFQFALQPGQRLHIVEYSSGALAREEVAARLGRLEGIVADLPPELTGLVDDRAPDEACCSVVAIDAELALVTAMDALTGRTVLFGLPDRSMLADVQVGDRVWVDQAGKVGFDPGDPCCAVRRP